MTRPESTHGPALPPPRFFFAVTILAGVFFGVWSWRVFADESSIVILDRQFAEHWSDWSRQHPQILQFMIFMTDLGGVAAMTLLAIMGAIWQTAINRRSLALAWLAIVAGGGLMNMATKNLFDRARPAVQIRESVVHESNESYPSGHAMGSAIGYGMLGYALTLPQRRRPRRIVAVLLLTAIVLGVGFSRIYLRAHWFSDVVAGWSIGLAWVCLCIGCLEWRRRCLHVAGPQS